MNSSVSAEGLGFGPDGLDARPLPDAFRPDLGRLVGLWNGLRQLVPEGAHAANFAFDVTPAAYITAIVTERGVHRPPYEKTFGKG